MMTSKNRQYIDEKGDRQMEVNMADIMKYAIGGAVLFGMIAIVIVTLFIKSKRRRERRKELEEKKKESYEVNQIKEEKMEKQVKVRQAPKEQKVPVQRQEEVIPKQEVTAKQEEAIPKQEAVQLEKQSDINPIHIAFYAVQATGREGNVAFSLGIEINIGRDKQSNDWVIENDQTVSSSHCRIYQQNGAVYIEDMGSTNGTYVNSQRIMRATRLENHDKVRIGQGEYRVRC